MATKKAAPPQNETEAGPTLPEPVSMEEARAIFAERLDVAAVLTADGTLHRDGRIT